MNVLNNVLTEEIISNILNDTYNFVVTRDMILESLNNKIDSINSGMNFYIVIIVITIIIAFISMKKINFFKGIIYIICITCCLTVITYQTICEKNAIEYSIKNNCWFIENDIIMDKYINENNDLYCFELKRNGKIIGSFMQYQNLNKGDNVCVLCVQDKFGKKYPIDQEFWPFEETLFIESLSLPLETENLDNF